MRHSGPPIGPLAMGIGVGLLATLLFLLIAFRRPWAPRRPRTP